VEEIPNKVSTEQLAAQRVLARPEALSDQPADEEEGAKKRKDLSDLYELDVIKPSGDSGTGAPVFWQPTFEFKRALMINSRDLHQPPALINLYYTCVSEPNITKPFDHFYCYDRHPGSTAKLVTSLYPEHLFINSINSMILITPGRYRQGSMLIQIAVEHSLNNGRGGKVELTSTNQSGQFYFKLGFLPKDETILRRLSNGENIDGRDMYLPDASIAAWKTKIARHRILDPKPAATYFQFFTAAVSPYIRQASEVLTGCCSKRKQP